MLWAVVAVVTIPLLMVEVVVLAAAVAVLVEKSAVVVVELQDLLVKATTVEQETILEVGST